MKTLVRLVFKCLGLLLKSLGETSCVKETFPTDIQGKEVLLGVLVHQVKEESVRRGQQGPVT